MAGAAPSSRVYNSAMTETPSRVRVVESHITSSEETVHFRTGDALGVGHHDQQWKAYVWCTDQHGHAGVDPNMRGPGGEGFGGFAEAFGDIFGDMVGQQRGRAGGGGSHGPDDAAADAKRGTQRNPATTSAAKEDEGER